MYKTLLEVFNFYIYYESITNTKQCSIPDAINFFNLTRKIISLDFFLTYLHRLKSVKTANDILRLAKKCWHLLILQYQRSWSYEAVDSRRYLQNKESPINIFHFFRGDMHRIYQSINSRFRLRDQLVLNFKMWMMETLNAAGY